jgi:thioesterase domain-containing protein
MIELSKQIASSSIAPDAVEAELTKIWRRIFNPKGLDERGHLLDSSIGVRRLMRFLRETEATLGYKIPPSALVRLGTVKSLAAAIQSGVWPQPSPLVLLRDGRTDCAVYFVSYGDGVILNLCDLTAFIDFPGQLWGLQLPGLDGETEPLTSILKMAQYFVDAVLEHGTATVYHMIGYSFSGLVVVEMARILQAQGRHVGLVGLLDTYCYERYWPRSQWFLLALRKAGRGVLEVRTMSPRTAVGHLFGKLAPALRFFRRRGKESARTSSPSQSIYYVGGLEPDFQRVRDASIVAFESHGPKPIDCKIVLFKSERGEVDPVGIWKRLTSDLEVVDVEGTHHSMIRKPFAYGVAAEISLRLARFPIPT